MDQPTGTYGLLILMLGLTSHALLFAERLRYGYGTILSVTTRNLMAVYGCHTG